MGAQEMQLGNLGNRETVGLPLAVETGEHPVPGRNVNVGMIFQGTLRGEGLLTVGAAKYLARITVTEGVA
jgi:hypothetical protein